MCANSQENITIAEKRYITLDLNGYVLQGTGTGSVITNNGTLTITDNNTATQVHYFTVDANGLWSWNDANVTGAKTLSTFIAGAVLPSVNDVIAVPGGCVTGGNGTNGGGIFNYESITINGGCVIGNKVDDYGGGIYSKGAALTVEGSANVIGNKADVYGGGIYSIGSGTAVTVAGSANITDNKAGSDGGGVYIANNALAVSGTANITGNSAGNNGGGIYAYYFENGTYGGEASVNVSGYANIAGNFACNQGGGIYLNSDEITVTPSAKANITDNKVGTADNNLYLPENAKVSVQLAFTGRIGVTTAVKPTKNTPLSITATILNDFSDYFFSDDEDYIVIDVTNLAHHTLKLSADVVAKIGTKTYDSVQAAVNAAGSGATIQMLTNSTENVVIAEGKNVTLDLNGKTLRGSATGSVITNAGTLNILDSGTDGAIILDSGLSDDIITNSGMLTFSNGTITAVNVTKANICGVVNSGTFRMIGGTIDIVDDDSDDTDCYGVWNNKDSIFVMEKGTITSGEYGVGNEGAFTMTGGAITACGGDGVENGGTFTMSGGVVESSTYYGVMNHEASLFTMEGGTITGSYEGVDNAGTFTMTGGTITGNHPYGVYNNPAGVATMHGGVIENSDYGVWNEEAAFIMDDGTITGCNTGVHNNEDGRFIVSGGTISGNEVNICNKGNKAEVVISSTDAQVVGLETVAAEIMPTDNSGNSTTVSLSAQVADAENASIKAVGAEAGKEGFLFLEISLTKKIGDGDETSVSQTNSVLEIIVPFDMSSKKYPVVYRVHDGTTDTFKEAGSDAADYGKDGTFYVEGSGADARIHFFTNKFSDYAVAFIENNTGMSLTLDGTIGVNFYVDVVYYLVSDWKTTYPEAYVKLTYNNNTTSYSTDRATVTYKLSEQFADSTTGMYKFTCTATPAQMNDTITIQLYNGTDTTPVYEQDTSIAAWCKSVIDTYESKSEKKEFVDLCKTLLDYGIAAQTLFGYNVTNKSNNGGYYNLSAYSATDLNSIPSFDNGGYTDAAGLTFMALSNSSLRIYYNNTITAGPTSDMFNVKTGSNSSQENYIEVYGIPAKKLNTEFTLTVNGKTLKACGLSYAKLVLENYAGTASTDTVNLCKALVLYNKAAVAYFPSN